MFLKICANTNLHDARLAAELGADAVGFVFATSKRQVTPEQVAEILQGLPTAVEKVGVFSTSDPHEVEHVVVCTGLTAAQLHTTYKPEMVRALSREFGSQLKIIQTVPYAVDGSDDSGFVATLQAALADTNIWAVLLDASQKGLSGGLGVTFDWAHVAALLHPIVSDEARILLAGGLHQTNVAEAVRILQPWGVDVASGVESLPGTKDPARLQAFLQVARG